MRVRLYQISPERDKRNLMFMNYEFTTKHGGIDVESYDLVFDGDLEVKRLDDIYYIFNKKLPDGYRDRSMSVSDVVYVEGLGTFFCDSIGYKQLRCTLYFHNKKTDGKFYKVTAK